MNTYNDMEVLDEEKTPQQEAFEESIAQEEQMELPLFEVTDINWIRREAK